VRQINADDVWAAGYEGQGVVIGGQDTGYDWSHPALQQQYRGWDGVAANHSYNWHDAIHEGNFVCPANSPEPCDEHGHGTHTMGTMVGEAGAMRIGVAPGARWIGCRNMDDNGNGTPASYAECFQWFLAPTDSAGNNPNPALAPDIINNSWGCTTQEGCVDANALLVIVDSVRAAGILTVNSAGNSGPGCGSVNTPPALYDASMTVGATDSADNIAAFSSRGPVSRDGSTRPKPDLVAPGVGVRSSYPGGYASLSGTSMAAPHVAATAALVISADPTLAGQVDRLEELMLLSARPRFGGQVCGGVDGATRPNNTYGWGRLDAYVALVRLRAEFELYVPFITRQP
jgi:subtilisin family serine protease